MTNTVVSRDAVVPKSVSIGRFCIIEAGVVLGESVIIEDYTMILAGTRIGRDTRIGTYSKIGRNVTVGDECSFTSFCEIRDDCIIGNRVSMGSRCSLAAGMIVEDDVLIKYGFAMTDTPNLRRNGDKVTSTLKKGSRFGAGVIVMPGIVIGENAEIGAASLVRQDVPANQVWFGSPARFYKEVD